MSTFSIGAAATNNAAPTTTTAVNRDLISILLFGALALLLLTAIYFLRKSLNVTFARIYGLVLIAVLAVSLAFANVDDAAKTAAFTLLGTVGGYLAGAKPTAAPPAGGGGGGGGDGAMEDGGGGGGNAPAQEAIL